METTENTDVETIELKTKTSPRTVALIATIVAGTIAAAVVFVKRRHRNAEIIVLEPTPDSTEA